MAQATAERKQCPNWWNIWITACWLLALAGLMSTTRLGIYTLADQPRTRAKPPTSGPTSP